MVQRPRGGRRRIKRVGNGGVVGGIGNEGCHHATWRWRVCKCSGPGKGGEAGGNQGEVDGGGGVTLTSCVNNG